MFAAAQCTPEQTRALNVLERELPNFYKLLTPELPPAETFSTGDKWFVPGKLSTSQIPRSVSWLWNQSRPRKTVRDQASEFEVCFFKLSTRRRSHAIPDHLIPNFKIWVFNVHILASEGNYAFVWCEKAESANECTQFIMEESTITPPKDDPNQLVLKDLAFLSPFVKPEIAHEFQWIRDREAS